MQPTTLSADPTSAHLAVHAGPAGCEICCRVLRTQVHVVRRTATPTCRLPAGKKHTFERTATSWGTKQLLRLPVLQTSGFLKDDTQHLGILVDIVTQACALAGSHVLPVQHLPLVQVSAAQESIRCGLQASLTAQTMPQTMTSRLNMALHPLTEVVNSWVLSGGSHRKLEPPTSPFPVRRDIAGAGRWGLVLCTRHLSEPCFLGVQPGAGLFRSPTSFMWRWGQPCGV